MEAKDTVMGDGDLGKLAKVPLDIRGLHKCIRTLIDAQAEISFKAGQEETERRHFKAGIREVVEWLESNSTPTINEESMIIFGDKWQAKLKEWE